MGLDPLMLEASQWYEESILSKKDDVVFEENRFAFVTDEDIVNEVEGAVPEKTKKQTRWCYNASTSWRESRLRRATCEAEKPPELCKMTKAELCLWLPRFIFEICKENGADYSEVSVYNIFCGIQRYIHQNGNPELDFFADSSFASVRSALDSKLKLLQKSDGGITNPSDIISIEEEEVLWSKGLLGEHSPDVLQDTIIFMCGLYFALCGGAELQLLKIFLKTGSTGENYLLYKEMGSKNNPGGLNMRKVAKYLISKIRATQLEILFAYIANIYQNVHLVSISFYKV